MPGLCTVNAYPVLFSRILLLTPGVLLTKKEEPLIHIHPLAIPHDLDLPVVKRLPAAVTTMKGLDPGDVLFLQAVRQPVKLFTISLRVICKKTVFVSTIKPYRDAILGEILEVMHYTVNISCR